MRLPIGVVGQATSSQRPEESILKIAGSAVATVTEIGTESRLPFCAIN